MTSSKAAKSTVRTLKRDRAVCFYFPVSKNLKTESCVFVCLWSFPWLTLSLTHGKAQAHTQSPSFIMVVVHGCQTYWIFNNIRIDWAVLAEPCSKIDTMTTYSEIKGLPSIPKSLLSVLLLVLMVLKDQEKAPSSHWTALWVLWCMDVSWFLSICEGFSHS